MWDLATIEAKKAELEALNSKCADLESQLEFARLERNRLCEEIGGFAVNFRFAIAACFGKASLELKSMPSLMAATVGRPNKAAAARKAATIQRKLAAAEAEKSRQRSELGL